MSTSLLYTQYRLKNFSYSNDFAKILAKYVLKLSNYFYVMLFCNVSSVINWYTVVL